MTDFRTTFEIPQNKVIDHQSGILLLGSCFSENIGNKLAEYKFPVSINPFGILYNPESIAQSIEMIINNKSFCSNDLFEQNGVFKSFYHHSRFSDVDENTCLKNINTSISTAHKHLKKSKLLLLTFGTAWVYQLNKTKQIVSNCHKVQAKYFDRFKLSTHQIINRYKELILRIQAINPEIQIIFTVSPVRHLKDGAAENQLSKATLIMASHQLVNDIDNCFYFPSYEIMMDDLRDYRFYNDDMVHPSAVAVNYVWDKFCDYAVSNNSQKLMTDINKITQAINHRPFNPETEAHQKFLKKTLRKMKTLEEKFNLDYSIEKYKITKQIGL